MHVDDWGHRSEAGEKLVCEAGFVLEPHEIKDLFTHYQSQEDVSAVSSADNSFKKNN
jgi:hypothetical protein